MYEILLEDNRLLKGKAFMLPKSIKEYLSALLLIYDGDKSIRGYKRLNNLLSMEGGIQYNELKRLKNYFDNYQGTKNNIEYILNGGDVLKAWVNATLNQATREVEDYKEYLKALGFKNTYRKPHRKYRSKKQQ